MAEVKDEEEVQQQQQQQQQHAKAMPPKRKPDLPSIDEEGKDENEKKQKLLETPALGNHCSSVSVENPIDWEDESDDDAFVDYEETDADDYDEDDDDDGEEGEDDEDADFDEEHSNGKAVVVDPKGKGIMVEGKGKGKLVEESDDSSEGGGVESDGGVSDLSDDPLTEVDLDNILPSRTRRRSVRPGVSIKDPRNNENNDGDA